MALKAVKSLPERTVLKQLCGGRYRNTRNEVCIYWLAGNCCRKPCKFLHSQSPPNPQPIRSRKTWRNPNYYNSKTVAHTRNGVVAGFSGKIDPEVQNINLTEVGTENNSKKCQETQRNIPIDEGERSQEPQRNIPTDGGELLPKTESVKKTQVQLCKYWAISSCVRSEKCKDLHSWFTGTGFSMLVKLEGHEKAITGISLPSGFDKLYSGCKGNSLRVWDCHTGQCVSVVNLGGAVGSLISEGPWLFVGLPNCVKAWNIQTQSEHILEGAVGQVYAMVVGHDMLFAGTEDGTILVWKPSSGTKLHELAAPLVGHSCAVLTLVVGAGRLYSGSMDKTIRVWDLETLQCIQTLEGHTGAVMSVICWNNFLLSGSLDSTIKVWAETDSRSLEVVYEHKEECGIIAFCGINCADDKPILLSSCNDNTVRLYDLPSFNERGRIFAKGAVRSIQVGTGGLFFTGDESGQLSIWKLMI